MKLILKNSRQIFEKYYLNMVDKNYTNNVPVNIKSFAEIRTITSIDVRITIYDSGSLSGQTHPFRLGIGSTSTVYDITDFVGGDHSVVINNGNILEFSLTGLDFSNTSNYPDSYSLKATIRTSDWESGELAKSVLYKVEYHLS